MPAMMTPMCRLLGKKTVLWALLTVMVLIPVGSMGAQPQNINYADCLSCHQGIEQISEHHDFACAACHLDPAHLHHPDSGCPVPPLPYAQSGGRGLCWSLSTRL